MASKRAAAPEAANEPAETDTGAADTGAEIEAAPPARPADSFRGKAQDVEPRPSARRAAAPEPEPDQGDGRDADGIEYVDEIDLDELERLRTSAARVGDLEQQLADLQAQIKEATGKVKAYEREKLTEQEKRELELSEARARATELEAQLRQRSAELEISRVAATFSVPAELAQQLLASSLEYDDAGRPKGVETAMRALIQKFPHIVERQPVNRGNGERPGGRGQQALTLEEIGGWTPEQINDRWAEVSAVMSGKN